MIRTHTSLPLAALALVPALLLGSAQAAGSAHGVSAAPPQSLALTLTDVTHVFGPGFIKEAGVALPNTYSAGASGTTSLSAKGRVSAYGEMFLSTRAAMVGYLTNSVDLYRSSAYARAAVQNMLSYKDKVSHSAKGKALHISALSGVGETAVLLTIASKGSAGRRGSYLIVDFSRGSYTAGVQIISSGKPDLSRVLALARIVDQRIQRYG